MRSSADACSAPVRVEGRAGCSSCSSAMLLLVVVGLLLVLLLREAAPVLRWR